MPSEEEHEDEDEDDLPFEVEIEGLPRWAPPLAAAVILASGVVAAGLAPSLVTVPLLVASGIARRFPTRAATAIVSKDAVTLDGVELRKGEIDDAWLDTDEVDARVTFAARGRLDVLYFQNREQARRFVEEIGERPAAVAGHRVRWLDTLMSMRFVALALALAATGTRVGAVIALLALPGLAAFVRAKQVVARADRLELVTWRGVDAIPWADVASVADGAVAMKGGRTVSIAKADLRDALLGSPAWLERARDRVLQRARGALAAR